MKIMYMGELQKRFLSVLLCVAMIVTMVAVSPGLQLFVSASEDDAVSVKVVDHVQLKIGNNTYDMTSYGSNIFETGIELAAGTYQVQLLVNGQEKLQKKQITVSEQKIIFFRLQNGKLCTSLEDGVVHTAAMTGNMGGIIFKKSQESDAETFQLMEWKPEDANGELEYVGGGRYQKTFEMEPQSEDTQVSYKVAFDDAWNYSLGENGNNIDLTIPAGTREFTVFTDEIGKTVYDSVRSGSFELVQNAGNVSMPKLDTVISLIGDVRENVDKNWAAGEKGYEFTQLTDSLYLYQNTFSIGTYHYKAVFNYEKWYEKGNNIALSITSDNQHVVFLYDSSTGELLDTVNQEEKVALKLHMDASVIKPSVKDEKDGSTSFVVSAASGAEVKLVYGNKSEVTASDESAMKKVDLIEKSSGKYVSDALYFGDDALNLVYYYEVNGDKVIFPFMPCIEVNGTSYMNYTRAEFEGRAVYVPGSFPGSSWNPASNQMTYLGNGLYSYTFQDVPAANYEYKIAFGSWAENYGKDGISDGANIAVTVPAVQDVTILYNDFSHKAVNSLDYITADIALMGENIPDGTKLSDQMLNGIYSVMVSLPAGTYSNLEMLYEGNEYSIAEFTITESKEVTFYFDPVSLIYYNDASDLAIDESKIYYNTKDFAYKSVYGAIATGQQVTFSIDAGIDVTEVRMVLKGVHKNNFELEKSGAPVAGVQKWSVTTSFDQIGSSNYYFVLSNGSTVTAYADDDGYYGEGKTTSLTSIMPYDLVVYQDGYETPDWMKNAVIYQIFPDRFFDGDTLNDKAVESARGTESYEYINDWATLPENPEQEKLLSKDDYESLGAFYGDGNWSNEIYGGDLKGITERIDYLKAVGVNVIYLNPVFTSISSHRYDTSDYSKIDPILGNLGDFDELVAIVKANNMHIILDGVFNHVSDDSIYFDRYYKYLKAGSNTLGAYPYWAYVYDLINDKKVSLDQAKKEAKDYFTTSYGITDFSYTEWFQINNTALIDADTKEEVKDTIGDRAGKVVYGYEGWWGYDSMPVILATDGSEFRTGNWADQVIYNNNEDSVTQYWLKKGANGWRLDVANEVSDETWQQFKKSVKALNSDDVIVGEIWTDALQYLLGDMYDSVMNYVFRGAILSYVNGGDSATATKTLEKIRERYPKEAYYAMMNLLGSHDTQRLLSALDGVEDDRAQKDAEHAFPTYEKTSDMAKQKQYLAAFLQFTYAGAPTIYYGDEIGMVGADDPDNRRGFTWGQGSRELVTWYAKLAAIRAQYSALRTGTMEPIMIKDNILGYVRRDDKGNMVVLANNDEEAQDVTLDLKNMNITTDQMTDLISGKTYRISNGKITVTVPALSGVILTKNVKEVTIDQDALAPAYDSSYVVGIRKTPEKPENPDDPDQPENPDNTEPAQTPDASKTGEDTVATLVSNMTDQTENGVVTNDTNYAAGFILLMIVSAGTAGAAYFIKKKKYD